MRKIINYEVEASTSKSQSPFLDYLSLVLGKPRIRLNNLKRSLRFPCLGFNPIIDSINLLNALVHISGLKQTSKISSGFFVPRRKSKGTIVLGSSVRPSISPSVRRHNLVSATPPTVFKGCSRNFPVIVPMIWKCAYFIEVMLDWFLSELWPFNNFSAVSLVSATPPTVLKGF